MNLLIMKIKMFISSYFPLYVILIILLFLRIDENLSFCELWLFKEAKLSFALYFLLVFVIISLFSVAELFLTKGNERYHFRDIKKTGDTIISYMMTYIVPILSIDFLSKDILIVNFILFTLIGFMYIRMDLVYMNPLWLLFGFYVFNTESDQKIISNIKYSELKNINENRLCGHLICEGVYLIRKKDNKDTIV